MIGPSKVNSKNQTDSYNLQRTEDDFNRSISSYATSQRNLMDKSQQFLQGKRTYGKNIHAIQAANTDDIIPNWVGCYKSGNDGLIEQTDLGNNTNITDCKVRASDLGYSTFALRQKGDLPGNTCFVGDNIDKAQSGGLATKSVLSYAFSKSEGANIGGLLMNGQIGVYEDDITNNLVTDLTPMANCDISIGGKINANTTVATYGYNCNGTEKSQFTAPPSQPAVVIPTPDGYTKYSNKDSRGNDIMKLADGTSINDLVAACDKNSNCGGFNSGGWVISTIKPQDQWYSDVTWQGKKLDLYVKNKKAINIDTSLQYKLKNVNSTNCLYNNTDGRFATYTCIDFNDQYWDIIPVKGEINTYEFRNANSIRSLYSDTNGNFSTAWSNNSNKFWWEIVPVSGKTDVYQLKNKNTNSCLYNNADGRFNMTSCVASYNDQWWMLIPVTTTGIKGAIGPLLPIRYITISTNNNYIQLSQLAVYSADNPTVNIALGKSTSAINTSGGKSSDAVDGNLTSRKYPGGYISTATTTESWTLDLGQEYPLSKIVYYNRGDCCQDRAISMTLTLKSSANITIWSGTPFTNDLVQTINIIPKANNPIPVVKTGSTINTSSLWSKPWIRIDNATWANSLTQLNDGTILCTSGDGNTYLSQINNIAGWVQQPLSIPVKSVIQLQDERYLGVGTNDNSLYIKDNIKDRWDGWNPSGKNKKIMVRYIKINKNKNNEYLQISQLAVYSNGVNIAPGKTASSPNIYSSKSIPSNAIDGVLSTKDYPNIYHSSNNTADYWLLDLGKEYDIEKIVYYNRRDCCSERANGMILQIFDSNMSQNQFQTGNFTLNSDMVQTILNNAQIPDPYTCCVLSIVQLNNGTLIGVGTNNYLYKRDKLTDKWKQIKCPSSCCVTSISKLSDGITLVAIGTNGYIYTRQQDQAWTLVDQSMKMSAVTQLKDGRIIGLDQNGHYFSK